jgi:hypothetical protein
MSGHRSSTGWSWSTTDRMTVRMSNGFLRSLLTVAEKISPTVVNSLEGPQRRALVLADGSSHPPDRKVGATGTSRDRQSETLLGVKDFQQGRSTLSSRQMVTCVAMRSTRPDRAQPSQQGLRAMRLGTKGS